MGEQDGILEEFRDEAKALIQEMLEILEDSEGHFENVHELEKYGQRVDRIMGAAKSLAVAYVDEAPVLNRIADYAELCKAVGYQTSQIKGNEAFYDVCVALLIDATEMLQTILANLQENQTAFAESFSKTFLERLRWVSDQFGEEFRTTLRTGSPATRGASKDNSAARQPEVLLNLNQNDIDELLKKLGL